MSTGQFLRQHNLRPRKGLGQHFLTSQDVLSDIAAAAHLTPGDTVVEVGPGLGALTVVMAQQAGRILAVEIDRDLAARLGEILAPYPNVRIIQDDILQVHLAAELPAGQAAYKVVANLPYYITTPALRYFFEQDHRPQLIVVTVQDEVARRMTARPPEMNFLAILVQFHGQAEIVRRVPAGAFYPPPKVESAVVRITCQTPPLAEPQSQRFLRLVSSGFSQPRKQIHNPLIHAAGLDRNRVMAALRASEIDDKRRAETLSLDEWLRLYHNITQTSGERSDTTHL
jgi:16S rRNA (adenine1518-N6/adenine1519-N6)-dimethyltransferase